MRHRIWDNVGEIDMKLKRDKKAREVSDEYRLFGSRKETDNLTAKLLTSSKNFQADLKKIRDDFLIPYHLTPSTDTYIVHLLSDDRIYDDLFDSGYVHGLLDEKNRKRFRKAIINVLEKYELGMSFFTWVQWILLYREPLPEGIVLDKNLFKRMREGVVENIAEPFRIARNTQEKKMILSWYRDLMKLPATGRIQKGKSKHYNHFLELLSRKKSKIRKPRVDHTNDFYVNSQHGTIRLDEDGEPIIEDGKVARNTYRAIFTDLSYDEANTPTPEQDFKGAQTFRKRNERLKKRINKLGK